MEQLTDLHPEDEQAVTTVKMDDSTLTALGQLLAAVADILAARILRRRGGPSALRLYASIITVVLLFAIRSRVRQSGKVVHNVVTRIVATMRHLAHPPASWAAP